MARSLAVAGLLFLGGCGGASSSTPGEGSVPTQPDADTPPAPDPVLASVEEREPNDSSDDATPLPISIAGSGDLLLAGDRDWWRFDAAAGDVVRIELFGVRADQISWDTARNVPRIQLVHPDGQTVLLTHDAGGFLGAAWDHGRHDLDIPGFHVPETGSYLVCVAQDDPSLPGGAYELLIQPLDLGVLQQEAESAGVGGANDEVDFAETILPGVLAGFHEAGGRDTYTFDITQPTTLYAEVQSYRNGRHADELDYFDPLLSLLKADGLTEVQRVDDAFFSDPALSQRLLTPGTYYLVVDESSVGVSAPYLLTLALSDAAATPEVESNGGPDDAQIIQFGSVVEGRAGQSDHDWFAFEGQAGDLVQVWLFDRGNLEGAVTDARATFWAPDGTTQLAASQAVAALPVTRTMLLSSGTHYMRIRSSVITTYAFELRRVKSADFESVQNDTPETADSLDEVGRAAGLMDGPSDVDVFALPVVAGELMRIRVFAERGSESDGFAPLSEHGSDFEPLLTILDAEEVIVGTIAHQGPVNGSVSGEGVADGLATLTFAFVPSTTGIYFLEVAERGGAFGAGYHYVIEVE